VRVHDGAWSSDTSRRAQRGWVDHRSRRAVSCRVRWTIKGFGVASTGRNVRLANGKGSAHARRARSGQESPSANLCQRPANPRRRRRS